MPDVDAVDAAIRDAAMREALPRFRSLRAEDIREKRPNDPVTAADLAMEAALRISLGALKPDAVFVGEEGVEADPTVLNRLETAPGAWIVDPIDGTRNYAAGNPCFAVIVAYAVRGQTMMGWIYDPTTESMMTAVKGQGAKLDGADLTLRADTVGRQSRVAYVGKGLRKRMTAIADTVVWPGGVPDLPVRLSCAGHEYRRVALGDAMFARFAGSPKPWDHAAGTLIVAEAGGRQGLTRRGGSPYQPGQGVREDVLLSAVSSADWDRAAAWAAEAGD